MRIIVAIIILALAICAFLAANSHKPFELRVDAQSSGPLVRYASSQVIPSKPNMVCMYVYIPGDLAGAPKSVVET